MPDRILHNKEWHLSIGRGGVSLLNSVGCVSSQVAWVAWVKICIGYLGCMGVEKFDVGK